MARHLPPERHGIYDIACVTLEDGSKMRVEFIARVQSIRVGQREEGVQVLPHLRCACARACEHGLSTPTAARLSFGARAVQCIARSCRAR